MTLADAGWEAVRATTEIDYDEESGEVHIEVTDAYAGIRTLVDVEFGMRVSVVPAQGATHGTFMGWPNMGAYVRIEDGDIALVIEGSTIDDLSYDDETVFDVTWIDGVFALTLDGELALAQGGLPDPEGPFEIYAGTWDDGEGTAVVNLPETFELGPDGEPEPETEHPWSGPRDDFGLRAPDGWVPTAFGGRRR